MFSSVKNQQSSSRKVHFEDLIVESGELSESKKNAEDQSNQSPQCKIDDLKVEQKTEIETETNIIDLNSIEHPLYLHNMKYKEFLRRE